LILLYFSGLKTESGFGDEESDCDIWQGCLTVYTGRSGSVPEAGSRRYLR